MEPSYTEQSYHVVAQSIAHELMREAVWSGEYCNWVNVAADYSRAHPVVQGRSMNSSVYNGLSGILLFVSKVYQREPDDILRDYINGIIKTLMLNYPLMENKWSYFMGQLGVLHTVWRFYNQIGDEDGLNDISSKLHTLLEEDLKNIESELLYGISGSINPLLELLEFYNIASEEILDKLGNLILQSATKDDHTMSWPSSISVHGLTGLSHGASGISMALLRLYELTSDDIYKQAAVQALKFENRYYQSHVCNWKDLRNTGLDPQEGKEEYSMAWCNGAPGIGLARLEAWSVLKENQWKSEAEIAFDKTRDYMHQVMTSSLQHVDFSLCHGLAGNALILLKAGRRLDRPDYIRMTEEVAAFGLNNYHQPALRWPSGSRHPEDGSPLHSYNLMLGTSGIGWFYLCLIDEDFELPNF